MHSAAFRIPCDDAESAQILLESLRLEAQDGPEGSQVTLTLDGTTLAIDLEAKDVSTLRAALNSMLRLLDTARRVVQDQQSF